MMPSVATDKQELDLYLGSVVIDVNDLDTMTNFWKEALGYEVEVHKDHWVKLSDPEDRGATVSLQKVPEPRREKNRLHLDLYSGRPLDDLERLKRLGARQVPGPEEDKDFVVLADPDGNLFCVIDRSST